MPGGAAVGVPGALVLLNGGADDLGHSWQMVVVLHGMVTIARNGEGLVIIGLLATAVDTD